MSLTLSQQHWLYSIRKDKRVSVAISHCAYFRLQCQLARCPVAWWTWWWGRGGGRWKTSRISACSSWRKQQGVSLKNLFLFDILYSIWVTFFILIICLSSFIFCCTYSNMLAVLLQGEINWNRILLEDKLN